MAPSRLLQGVTGKGWQESDRGESVAEWLEEVEAVQIPDIDVADHEQAIEQLEAMNYTPISD